MFVKNAEKHLTLTKEEKKSFCMEMVLTVNFQTFAEGPCIYARKIAQNQYGLDLVS